MLRTGILPSPSKSRLKRVTATDGSGDPLKGLCVFFLRPNNNKSITSANIAEELVCGALDATNGRSLLTILQEYLKEIMVPALQSAQNWGTLQHGQVDNFMTTLNAYIHFLQSEYL